MAYFDTQMDGARDYTLRLHVNQNGQNLGGNYSSFGWALEAIGSWGSFGNYATGWSVNIGGQGFSGTIPSFNPNPSQVIASGNVYLYHDGNGNLTFHSSGYWNSSHGNIGAGTTGGNYSATRIPKSPQPPHSLSIDSVTPTSFGVRYTRGDNMGAGIDQDLAQWSTDSNFNNIVWNDTGPGGYTNPAGVGMSLPSGQTYWVRIRSHNSQGWSGWSPTVSQMIGLPPPTMTNLTQNGSGDLIASWTWPSITTGLIGYRIQVAQDPGFTVGVVSVDLPDQLSYAFQNLGGGRRYYVRVNARTSGGLNTWSNTLNHLLILDSGDLAGWWHDGPTPNNVTYFTGDGIRRGSVSGNQAIFMESLSTGASFLPANTYGIRRRVYGLTVGKAYRVVAKMTSTENPLATQYRLVWEGTVGTPITVPAGQTVDLPPIEFVASTASHTIAALLATDVNVAGPTDEVERMALHSVHVLELDTDFPQRLRSTVFESNLANHFDLAANSVGASWYVAKDGVTRFRLPGASLPVSAVFSDEATPGAVSYVDVAGGTDTRSTVNRIEATNYGELDGNEDNDSLIVEDLASQAKYGTYRSTLNLNLYDEAPYAGAFATRLADLLERHRIPKPLVPSIRWNAQEDLQLANELEVGQRVTVHRRGRMYDQQIASITHEVTPTRWIVTLTFNPL